MNKVIFVDLKQDQMKLIYTFLLSMIVTMGFGQDKINWLSWEDAMKASEKQPKKIYIDLYTDWCGWCKKMDASTFVDPEVVKYMNENFHAIKFNAEQKEDIVFNDHTFSYSGTSGRRGVHQLAYSLLNGRLGYPSFVILDEEKARILISPGFKDAKGVMMELVFAKEEKYKTISWETFKAQNAPPRPPAPTPAGTSTKTKTAKPSATNTNVVKTTNKAEVNQKQKMKEEALKKNQKVEPGKEVVVDKKVEKVKEKKEKKSKAAKLKENKVKADKAKTNVESTPKADTPLQEEVIKVAQEMPRFPGCEEIGVAGQDLTKCSHEKMFMFIQENLKYPKDARKNEITGTAIVQFVVGKNGKIRDANLLRDVGGGCGQAALDMVNSMPNWVPGKQDGKTVAVQYSLPVKFKL